MAIRLADVPVDQIRVGLKLISAIGNAGVIDTFDPDFSDDYLTGFVTITWANGKRSAGEPGDLIHVTVDPSEGIRLPEPDVTAS